MPSAVINTLNHSTMCVKYTNSLKAGVEVL